MPKEWLQAKGSSCGERCEDFTLQLMFYTPVIVAFGLYATLISFYVAVSNTLSY